MTRTRFVTGSPASAVRSTRQRAWHRAVVDAAAVAAPASGVELAFTLEPGRWVDLDSVTAVVLGALRAAGLYRRGHPELDAVLATRRDGDAVGVALGLVDAGALRRRRPPGPARLDARAERVPRPGALTDKRAWRDRLASAWGDAPALPGRVWADVELAVVGSLLTPLEPVLDGLEPVLGRDPRGMPRQEFFPNDDRITWLRLRRARAGSSRSRVRLRLGEVTAPAR